MAFKKPSHHKRPASTLLKQRLIFWGLMVLFIVGAYFYIVQPWRPHA